MNLLLHVCCAPCASWSIERVKRDGHRITLFYDNPNISPETERKKRLDYVKFLSDYHKLELIIGETPHEEWLSAVRGLESEPERGRRCTECFRFNLSLAEKVMKEHGLDGFTTTLTVSRFKDSAVIFKTARQFEHFIEYNFKKEDGFRKSVELSEKLGLYRQNYCGCEFSLKFH